MKKLILSTLLIALLLSPALALGEQNPNVVDTEKEVYDTIDNIANWLFRIFMIIATVMLVITAFQFLFAGGDTDKFSTAKRALVYTAVAVAVAVLSKGIVTVIKAIILETAG